MESERPLCKCHGEPRIWHKDAQSKQGGYWRCRVKKQARDKRWRKKNPEKKLAATGRWNKKNPEKIAAHQRGYRERHKALGLCVFCSREAEPGKVRCVVHEAKEANYSYYRGGW